MTAPLRERFEYWYRARLDAHERFECDGSEYKSASAAAEKQRVLRACDHVARGLGLDGDAMNRRGFLGTILAAAVAPAIVRADSLMRIVPRDTLFMDADLLYGTGDFTIEMWLTADRMLIDELRITRGVARYEFPLMPQRVNDGWTHHVVQRRAGQVDYQSIPIPLEVDS